MLERIVGMCVNDMPKPHVLTSASANLMLLFIGGRERWFVHVSAKEKILELQRDTLFLVQQSVLGRGRAC